MFKVDQVTRSGKIVQDYDQKLSVKEIRYLFNLLFNGKIEQDGKQFILFGKIGILGCNVSYLGYPHPAYKKRIQLKEYYLDYLFKNRKNNIETLYVGIYTYNKTRLYVVFEPVTYAGKKSHNSSAHVYSINLQYAQKASSFSKVDMFGNTIRIFNEYEFVRYIKTKANDPVYVSPDKIIEDIHDYISCFQESINRTWNGITCYKEMIEANDSNAKQAEWPGWYFEFLFKNYLKDHENKDIEWHGKKGKGEIDLDLKMPNFKWVFGDLKADQMNNDILGNSIECLDKVIREHDGIVYYICCLYEAKKDSECDYEVTKFWDTLRGGVYAANDYVDMGKRYGKKMKNSVKPKILHILKIDPIMYEILRRTPYEQGVNSNGDDRKPKLKVSKKLINALSIYSKAF